MSKRTSNPDVNQTAARIVAEVAAQHEKPLPADVEAAWETWIASISNVDTRTKTLLRAAFEAGVEAGRVDRR